jgi:hypothetical protein
MYLDAVHNATLLTGAGMYARDFKTQITPNATQRVTLIVAGCYIVAIAILWYDIFMSTMPPVTFFFQACTGSQAHQ